MALRTPASARRKPSRPYRSPAQNGPVRRSRPTGFNIFLIILSAIVGLASWYLGRIIYDSYYVSMPRPLLIGILFALLCLALCFVIQIYSISSGCFERNIVTGNDGVAGNILMIVLSVVLVFGLGVLFQWIYGLDSKRQITEPTSYVFVIDDSGSMEGNDPNQERYNAIRSVMLSMPDSFDYMVYGFSDSTYIIRDMAPKSAGIADISGNSYGGTSIKGALTQVLDDWENGVWDGGESPKVILLTDGYATDIGMFSSPNKVLQRYANAQINVSTVGLGSVDVSLMDKIAKMTGGVFVDVKDVSDLADAMASAISHYSSKDLLSARYQPNLNFLFGFLRVLFLSILGMLIGFAATIAYGFPESVTISLIGSAVKAVIGALLMELGTGVFGFSDRTMWLILWILIATLVAVKIVSYTRRSNQSSRVIR